MSDVALSQYA